MLLSDTRFALATQDCRLAWQNLRPAPKVTIDFGDGKKLQRTLKGSTVIYLCRPDGSVIHALPGIYTPEDFLAEWPQAMQHLNDTDAAWSRWHGSAEMAAVVRPMTASKAIMQGPLLRALGESSPASPSLDMSRYPVTRTEVAANLGLPPAASGSDIVAADSRRYREVAIPKAHEWLARSSRPPSVESCTLPLFKEVLGVPIDDPWLGLKDDDLPGTR
ncbi:MAG: hypothetical protein KF760_16230 [Candidatus Eremiobacteraeota bacterium]|nr:hypothetical protein [Candidatus Eremiobacteraeota bacterium]MCW5867877.1 hypothetical protein [Candidatus Eremiobacteraeota bacterium]